MLHLVLAGAYVNVHWAQIDLSPTPLQLGHRTAFPSGGELVHTSWTDVRPPVIEVGPPTLDPLLLSGDLMFCNGGLFLDRWPKKCSNQELVQLRTQNMSISGILNNDKYTATLVYQKEDSAGYPLVLNSHVTVFLNERQEACVLSANYNTRIQRWPNASVVVTLYAKRTENELWISALIAVALALGLVVWSQQPLQSDGTRYRWLEADVAIAPAALHFGRITQSVSLACAPCSSFLCRVTCGQDETSFLWAITGIALPCAVTWSLSDYFPRLKPYKLHHALTFSILELSLMSGSLSHLPQDGVGSRAYELAGFLVGTAMLVVTGRAIAVVPITWADVVIVFTISGLVLQYVAWTLYRPLIADHPSISPDEWGQIALTGLVLALAPMAAGAQIGKNRFQGI